MYMYDKREIYDINDANLFLAVWYFQKYKFTKNKAKRYIYQLFSSYSFQIYFSNMGIVIVTKRFRDFLLYNSLYNIYIHTGHSRKGFGRCLLSCLCAEG